MTLVLVFSDGGSTIATSPDATLTGLQVNADGCLEFAGSSLVGTYETPESEPTGYEKGERFHLHAFAVANQVHPILVSRMISGVDDPNLARWSVEGPLWTLPSESVNCTLLIEVSILAATATKGGGWGDWTAYKPGVYWGVAFKWRVTVTRPDTTYQISLCRFQTRSTRVQKQRYEYSLVERASSRRIFRR